jgi:hypothetical protein
MNPPLSSDDDTDFLFENAATVLERAFGYSEADAGALMREYFRLFQNRQFCESLGIPVQDETFFHHEGPIYMAMRAHYYLSLKADPNPSKCLHWMVALSKEKWELLCSYND